ncbi:MAG: Methyltransferase type 12 [Anaerocolumna sp.]|jgi:SAM-dependent methyltransferase|nr:Methyltransferase type 12 [Anaerocolumna sp.]
MQAYTGFAQVYDIFMDNVPYDEWTEYLTNLLKEYGIASGLILELGCGTGNVTRRLADKGYDMIGIDYSEEMLEIAREQEFNNYYEVIDNTDDITGDIIEFDLELQDNYEDNEIDYKEDSEDYVDTKDYVETKDSVDTEGNVDTNDYVDSNDCEMFEEDQDTIYNNMDDMDYDGDNGVSRILYLQQDMRSFELYGTVAAVVSICDSMNYITSEADLLQVFKLVNNYLDPNGIFIFDMNTEFKYKHILGDNTIAENREECSFIWENYYYDDKQINEYNMTIFVKLEEDNVNSDELIGDAERQNDIDEESTDRELDMEDKPMNVFERFKEIHYQKAYSFDVVKQLLKEAGMEFIAVYDAFTHNPPTNTSERVYFIARENFQENKKYL